MKQGCIGRGQQRDMEDLEVIRWAVIETRETYGPSRLSKHLRQQGHPIGRVRVERLMRENNIVPKDGKEVEGHHQLKS